MAFSSISFFVFFAVVYFVLTGLSLLWNVKPERARYCYYWVLLISSYIFAGYTNYKFCAYLAVLTLVVFYSTRIPASKKRMIFGVLVGLSGLIFCKYSNFFIEEFNRNFGLHVSTLHLIAPIGISFYTFSAIGYVVDVYRGNQKDNNNFLEVALFLSYFPKFVSGPLISSELFFERLRKTDGVRLRNIERGLSFFVIGLFKKIVLADHLCVFVDDVFGAPSAFSTITIWLAVLGYAFQLYFDFSGYSDMAMGISEMLGIELDRNFNLPYLSRNLTEFWKRWHISLSAWLQKYLYIPLGGNRKGTLRTYVNLFLVMLIGGVWHGSGFNFIIWGALHGIGLVVHKIYARIVGKGRKVGRLYRWVSQIATFMYVAFCWIFFRAATVSDAFALLRGMFIPQSGVVQIYSWLLFSLAVYIGYLAWLKQIETTDSNHLLDERIPLFDLSTIRGLVVFFLFCGLTVSMAYFGNTFFIYGKF